MENKTKKYFKYAIGEIMLVVIGILIALSINNWNEKNKEKTYENQVYKQIYNDIRSDSLRLSLVINYYVSKDTIMNQILYDSVPKIAYDTLTNENQRDFAYGAFLVGHYAIPVTTKKGYQLFKSFNTTEIETDSLSFYIENHYSIALRNEEYNEKISIMISKNIKDFQQKDWFLDFTLNRKLNPSYLDYIKNSDDFKTRIYDYQIYAIKNHLRDLKSQKERAEILKKKIKNRLEL